jgi:hypothetical protein
VLLALSAFALVMLPLLVGFAVLVLLAKLVGLMLTGLARLFMALVLALLFFLGGGCSTVLVLRFEWFLIHCNTPLKI